MRWTTQIGVMLLCYVVSVHTLDCRKFVFAPSCRGVSAKRSEPYAEELIRHNDMDGLDNLGENEMQISEDRPVRSRGVNSGADRLMRQLLTSFAQYWTKNKMAEGKDY